MNRKQLHFLESWLKKRRRKPLMIRGARQVGKSTLVKIFAELLSRPLAEINLERHTDLAALFSQNDPDALIDVLESLRNVPSINDQTLLFLDEIQATPEAIPALRYLFEDRSELAVLAAGSLLEFVLAEHDFSMPVGRVEYLHMGPMTFTEFLDAVGECKLLEIVQRYEIGEKIQNVVHDRLMQQLRHYLFVGGMPEAVDVFANTRNLQQVGDVHSSIIDTYREDFPKYIGSRSLSRINSVFNYAARNIGNKVKYSNFASDEQSKTIKKDIELLCQARVLTKVIHSHCSGIPLQASLEEKIYKLLFLDVGLMNAICGLRWFSLEQAELTDLVNEGVIAEQFIGQHLIDMLSSLPNRELNYWLRQGRSNNAEIDYVIAMDGQIVPIEVKSGATGRLRSLHQFMGEKNLPVAIRFDASVPSSQQIQTTMMKNGESTPVDYRLISLPLYLVERLPELVLM